MADSQPPAAAFPDPLTGILQHGSINTLSGASGVGKTAFLAGMVREILAGRDLFGYTTTPPPAIGFLACDRPWRDHAAWFTKAGVLDAIRHLSLRDQVGPTGAGYHWDGLRNWQDVPGIFGSLIKSMALPPGSLLIVDPLALFLPGRLNDYKDMAIAMGNIDSQLKPMQVTLLGVLHTAKQKADTGEQYRRPQDRVLGSGAQLGYSETSMYLIDPDEANHPAYEFGIVPHQYKASQHYFIRDTNGLFVPYHDLDGVEQEEIALSLLPNDSPVSTSVWISHIKSTCECSDATAKRLIGRLQSLNRVTRPHRGQYQRARVS